MTPIDTGRHGCISTPVHSITRRPSPNPFRAGRLRRWWNGLVAVIGAVAGIAPHVLHHVALLAGTALIAGTTGTALLGILGLVLAVPLRLRRRFGSWWAPTIGLAVFTVMLFLSAFLIGPAITGTDTAPPGQPRPSIGHDNHHDNAPGGP